MKKYIFVLACLFLLTIIGNAQTFEFAPVGAEWYYARYYRVGYDPTGIAYDKFTSLRTVEINGIECKEIELYRHLNWYGVVDPYTELRYIHQEGDQIYEVEDGEMYLLYDFSKGPGEYWVVPKYNDTIRVGSISYITLDDGTNRKVLETEPTVNYDLHIYYVIEGIGMDESLFPFYYLDGDSWLEGPLRCYFEDGTQLISSETECDYEVLDINEMDEKSIVIMNTIVNNSLHVEFSEMLNGLKKIQIINITGTTVYSSDVVDNQVEIQFSDKPSGVYLLSVKTGSREFNVRFIKV